MPLRSEWLVLYGAVVALYLFVAWREWSTLSSSAERLAAWPSGLLAVAFVLHGVLLWQAIIGPEQFHFGFASALSATLWLTVLIVWAESYFSASRGLLLLVLPLAALASGLPVLFPGAAIGPETTSIVFRLHLVLAILAYSLLTIAAMQALLMATMDRRLHGDVLAERTPLARFLDRLPPLLAMETVLFRLITERGRPSAKIGVSEETAGLSLAGPTNTKNTYVILEAKQTASALTLKNEDGREQILKP